MHRATLNINGEEEDIRALIQSLAFVNDMTWKNSPYSLDQQTFSRFDFSMALAESHDPEALLKSVAEYLIVWSKKGANVMELGLSAEITLSFELRASEQYAIGVAFSNLQLQKFIDCGIYLRVETQWAKEESPLFAASQSTTNSAIYSG